MYVFFFTMYLGYCVYVSAAYPLSRLRQAAAVVYTLVKTEIIYTKNVGALVAMNFT